MPFESPFRQMELEMGTKQGEQREKERDLRGQNGQSKGREDQLIN